MTDSATRLSLAHEVNTKIPQVLNKRTRRALESYTERVQ